MNLIKKIETNAQLFADSIAIIDSGTDKQITYQELWDKIQSVAAGLLSLDIKNGDRVALLLRNGAEFIICYYAILSIGAIAVPINIQLKGNEIQYVLNDSGAKAIIVTAEELAAKLHSIRGQLTELQIMVSLGERNEALTEYQLEDWLESKTQVKVTELREDQPAAIHYSSGTTGRMKGIILSHGNIISNAHLNGNYVFGLNDQDRVLGLSPFCHVFFFLIVLGPLCVGATVVTVPKSSPHLALSAIEKYKITHFAAVPTIFRYMLQCLKEQAYDLNSWRVAGSAGSSIDTELIHEIQKNFEVDFFESYGCTETSSTVTYNRLRHLRPGSIGQAAHGYQVRLINKIGYEAAIGEVGEIQVKGPGVFKGYWGRPDCNDKVFTSEGWYKTGDLATEDKDSFYYIVGREKDMIVSGGYNVYPKQVEEILLSHPDIEDAIVVGASDENLGEIPIGYVILKSGAEIQQEEIISFCKERMAKYKVPHTIEIVMDFPRTYTGKISRASFSKVRSLCIGT